MAFWLRSEERRVAARGRRVRGEAAAARIARRELTTGLRRELARPKVLLAFFAAGLGYGWMRRDDSVGNRRPSEETEDSAEVHPGRIATVVAAVLAGVRIYDRARRAAVLLDRYGRSSVPLVQDTPDRTQH